MSEKSCVDMIVATRSFERAIKHLKSKHENKVLTEIYNTVVDLAQFKISTQKSNHPLHNASGHKDIHIAGGKLILLYRYDEVESSSKGDFDLQKQQETAKSTQFNAPHVILKIALRLQDVVNHTQLKSYNKYKSPTREYDIDDIISSQEIDYHSIYDEFMTWYNHLSDDEQWDVDDIADSNAIPFYENCTDAQLIWLQGEYYKFVESNLPHNHLII